MFSIKKLYFIVLSVGSLFCSAAAFAGTNPIGYSLTPSTGFPATTQVGSSYSVAYTLTNNIPFPEPLGTIASIIVGTGFTVTDQCSGNTLAASGSTGDTCQVDIRFHPSDAGAHSIQLILAYDRNRVPLPTLSTTSSGSSSGDMTGKTTEPLPASTTVNTGYHIQFTFTNEGKADSITADSITYTGDSAGLTNKVNGCVDPVTPGNSCHVTATYTPSSNGENTVGASYNYDSSTQSATASTHTISSGGSGGCASVSGSTPLAMPTSTYIYGDNVVEFKFTNQCDAASAVLGTVDLSATLGSSSLVRGIQEGKLNAVVTSWITKGADTCSGQTLPPDQSCTVKASVIPEATGSDLNINAQVSYTESSQTKNAQSATTSNVVKANTTTERTITIINQCNVPVWITPVAAAAFGVPTPTCDANKNGCPTDTECFTANGDCYYSNPSVSNDGELLGVQANQAPSTMDITVSEDNAIVTGTTPPGNVIYNAGIAARLGCTGTGSSLFCTENNCDGTIQPLPAGSTTSAGVCAPGVGPVSTPGMSFNAVEFTFLKDSNSGETKDGVYDEQTINGVNIPMEMKGRGPASAANAPYNDCEPTGAIIQKTTSATNTQLGACTYSYTTPSTYPYNATTSQPGADAPASNYRFVTPVGETFCESTDAHCDGTGYLCGLAYHDFSGATGYKLTKMCGTLQGYVSINTGICSQADSIFHAGPMQDLKGYYNCGHDYTYSTGAELYACHGAYAGQSCYNPDPANPPASCCGCQDWWDNGITVPHGVGTPTQLCGIYTNPDWTTLPSNGTVQSQIQWVKEACPTAYSYQYDDPSSSFHCTVTSGSNITTNYQVTLCPGGASLSG